MSGTFSKQNLEGQVAKCLALSPEEVRSKFDGLENLDSPELFIANAKLEDDEAGNFDLTVIGVMFQMMMDSRDAPGCRRAFVALLAKGNECRFWNFLYTLGHCRRETHFAIRDVEGLAIARAFEKNSLADILAVYPAFSEEFPYYVPVYRYSRRKNRVLES